MSKRSDSAQSSLRERSDPHYRLFVYSGPESRAASYDLTGVTIAQVQETVRVMTRDDAELWALALVERDAAGNEGLQWLSGMNYNAAPTTGREWELRREMQDRYLEAQSNDDTVSRLPNGLRLIRLFPEWGAASPLWEDSSDDYNLAGADLGLSANLCAELADWSAQWGDRDLEDETLPAGWVERGTALLDRVSGELDGIAEVRPEFLPR